MVSQNIDPGKWITGKLGTASIFLLLIWTAVAGGAPITFNTALPVAEDEFIFRQQFVFDQSGDDPSGADRDREVLPLYRSLVTG